MIKLLSSSLFMSIVMLCSVATAEETHGVTTGSISGQIMIEGKGPMAGGTVFFFSDRSGPPPSATKYWRVPTHAINLDAEGRFQATLPVGHYYMGASKKLSGGRLGPPREGDYFFISEDEKGNSKLHMVLQFKPLDLGVIAVSGPFRSNMLVTEGITSIEGNIRDVQGKPIEGMLVFAFTTPMMVGRPLYVSERSDKIGNYLLRLYGGGKYYLRARSDYGGGPPSADEVMGIYNHGKPLSLLSMEQKKGVDIIIKGIGIPE